MSEVRVPRGHGLAVDLVHCGRDSSHHAGEKELYGHWMIEELRRHGCKIGPELCIRCCIASRAKVICAPHKNVVAAAIEWFTASRRPGEAH
jgi:hypothetical protein